MIHYSSASSVNNFMDGTMIALMITLSSSLLWFSAWIFLYGIKIYLLLRRSTLGAGSIAYKERIQSTMRIVAVIAPCALCYLLRAFLVGILCVEYFGGIVYSDVWFSWTEWFLCSQWVPTLIPVREIVLYTYYN